MSASRFSWLIGCVGVTDIPEVGIIEVIGLEPAGAGGDVLWDAGGQQGREEGTGAGMGGTSVCTCWV